MKLSKTDVGSIPKWEWTEGDLNPRPPECKSGVHTKLNYRPIYAFLNCFHILPIFRFCFEIRFKEYKTCCPSKENSAKIPIPSNYFKQQTL